jgi:hypothetical protein
VGKIKYTKLHIFEASDALASLDDERKNVGRLSFSAGDDRYVFVLDRSGLMHLAHQIEQLFEPPPPPSQRQKGRRT